MEEGFLIDDKRSLDSDGNLKEGVKKEEPLNQVPEQKAPQATTIEKLLSEDIIGRFIDSGLMPSNYIVNAMGDKITPVHEAFRIPSLDIPWLFVNNCPGRVCKWQMDKSMLWQFVPRMCRNCWKIVVYPRTLLELLKLKSLMELMSKANPYCYCKCGIEKRPSVGRNYGGYFYTDSLQAGLCRLEEVREMVHTKIHPDIKVILKRGCTEYEFTFGDSSKWDQIFDIEFWNAFEDKLDGLVAFPDEFTRQPTLIKHHVVANWIRFAWDRGDETVKQLNAGRGLTAEYMTYDYPKEEIENDQETETED